jgi:hypothetical protein
VVVAGCIALCGRCLGCGDSVVDRDSSKAFDFSILAFWPPHSLPPFFSNH